MGRKKIKLAWVANKNIRAASLKKKIVVLVKKVSELTILCDVKTCMIVLSPKENEPMVWRSVEEAQDLVRDFFALQEFERINNETSLESYLMEKTRKVEEKLMKIREKKKEYTVDQLMVQLNHGRKIGDLNLREIYGLLSFSKEKITRFMNRLGFTQYLPIHDPPVNLFDAETKDLITTTNDVFMIEGGQDDERSGNTYEASKKINISLRSTR
ncbi:unnamed protein product [Arabis nemorensis]|uniref:MADS-box domain-containing protein n=1 Tax=Arabis nemorensis TaxID=586526 RepID=A0A565BK42_9BRAS|nr:unnamed protein product [Arabis nemorensis]